MTVHFGANSFVTSLETGASLTKGPIGLSVDGLAKPLLAGFRFPPVEPLPTFLFSPGKTCAIWIPMPAAIVDHVESLNQTGDCKGADYPYVRVFLKAPSSAESSALMSLWAASLPQEISKPAAGASPHESGFALFGGVFDRWKCARCVSANLALGIAVAAAVAVLGPAIGAATAVSSLVAQFGISEGVAVFAVGGASGAAIAQKLCGDVC